MSKKEDQDKTATKQQTEYLKCDLTREEVEAAASDLAKELDDLQALENQLTALKAEFKAKIEKCEATIRVKQRLVRDKYEHRNVECDVVYNYTKCTVIIIRKDIDKIVEERKMTLGEKQMKMDFDGEEKTGAEAA